MDMAFWDRLRGLRLLGQLLLVWQLIVVLWKLFWRFLDWAGTLDFAVTSIGKPWVGKVVGQLLDPPPWLTLPTILLAVVLILWDSGRHRIKQPPSDFTPRTAAIPESQPEPTPAAPAHFVDEERERENARFRERAELQQKILDRHDWLTALEPPTKKEREMWDELMDSYKRGFRKVLTPDEGEHPLEFPGSHISFDTDRWNAVKKEVRELAEKCGEAIDWSARPEFGDPLQRLPDEPAGLPDVWQNAYRNAHIERKILLNAINRLKGRLMRETEEARIALERNENQ
jgi:hypothetical protein